MLDWIFEGIIDWISETITGLMDAVSALFLDLYDAIRKLQPQQQALLKKVFWEEIKQVDIARAEGIYWTAIQNRLARIYTRLKKLLEE